VRTGSLTLRVITPDKIALDEQVETVRLPGVDGSMGVLPRHAHMVAALSTGELSWTVGGEERFLFVSGGFAEVRDGTVRVVSEAGESPAEIDAERARRAEARARERLGLRLIDPDEIDFVRAEAALERALVRLQVSSRAF
jgi:F-type H+-transporting ATPase subunit epsilon